MAGGVGARESERKKKMNEGRKGTPTLVKEE
jgi:hypothetical protein